MINIPLDLATTLSLEWKSRALMCKKDLFNLISKKQGIVEELVEKEDYKYIDNEMSDIFKLQQMFEELKEILDKYKLYHLPYDVVERISFFEREIYKRSMTSEKLDDLNRAVDEQERFNDLTNDMLNKINEMWDDNASEEDIKSYIREKVGNLFSNFQEFNEQHLNDLTDSMFLTITAGKNVRINLNEEQISNLTRQNGNIGVCGTCLEEYTENDEMIILHCEGKHTFHQNCIIPWLKMSVYCPTCRHDLRN